MRTDGSRFGILLFAVRLIPAIPKKLSPCRLLKPLFSSCWFQVLGVSVVAWQPALASQGYGVLRENRAVEGDPLKIAGKTHSRGLETHAISEIHDPVPSLRRVNCNFSIGLL